MPTGRERALRILETGRARVAAPVAAMTDEQISRPTTLGGGDWSVKDLIDHVASWERRALDAIRARERDEPVEALIGVAGVDAVNARNVAASRRRSLDRIRRDADAAHETLVVRIGSLTDADWRSLVTMSTGRRHRLGTVLGSITGGPAGPFDHASAHLPDLLAYAGALRRTGRAPRP